MHIPETYFEFNELEKMRERNGIIRLMKLQRLISYNAW